MKYSRPSLGIEDNITDTIKYQDNLINIICNGKQSNIFLRNRRQFNRPSLEIEDNLIDIIRDEKQFNIFLRI